MAIRKTNQNFNFKNRDIKYLNKDFRNFKSNLIEYSKTYFPKTFNDFSEASPGTLFIELSSYIGDVLSYYIDDTFKESLLPYAEDRENIINLAQTFGYKPNVTFPAITTLSLYQLVPSIFTTTEGLTSDSDVDSKYFLKIKSGMTVSSATGIRFRVLDSVDFGDEEGREISIYETDINTGEVTFYLVKKQVQAISADIRETTFTIGQFEPFKTLELTDTNIINIVDVRDANGNKYYEVPYLAQEMVFIDFPNTEIRDPELSQFKDTVPFVLKTLRTSRRFVTRINPDNTLQIQFGAGNPDTFDETIIPTLKNVGLGLPNSINKLDESFDPTNFLKTKSYGVSPSNTTITVKYLLGGGVESNVPRGSITNISAIEYDEDLNFFSADDLGLYNTVKNSLAVDNEIPASGGRGGETLNEIRENALANFGSQNRAVTGKDYQVRVLSMPSKYGSISKAYAASDGTLDNNSPQSVLQSPNALQEFTDLVLSFTELEDEVSEEDVKESIQEFLLGKITNVNEKNNPFAVNLYVLGVDRNNHLTNTNIAVKENLKTYLNEYRILTDGINILDGFIINIAVDFEVVVFESFDKNEVIAECIDLLKEYFSIDKWSFNQTINLSEIELLLANADGVSSVSFVNIANKCNGEYSPNSYNVQAATKDKIVYPSLDPSVFEVKFPNRDITGRAR